MEELRKFSPQSVRWLLMPYPRVAKLRNRIRKIESLKFKEKVSQDLVDCGILKPNKIDALHY